MVNFSVVPSYRAPPRPAPAAAMRRAAGYPVAAAYSRPALQRDWKDPADLAGLQGPGKLPALPEVGRRRRRALAQISAAVIPPADDASGGSSGAPAAPDAPRPPACARGAACFAPRGGFSGLDAPPAGTMGLAVGLRQALQAAGGVMTVFNLGATGAKSTVIKTVSLSKVFAAVAPSCDGVHDAAALYDKHAGRFVVAAACGGFGRLLIGVSATGDAAGTWFMFGLVADAVDTPLECVSPREQAVADYPQLGYNRDGLFVTYHSYCPSRPAVGGASLLAIPKYKAYQGAPSMYYAVYTAAEVAAAAGLPGGATAVRQLQPVVPQAADDVAEGVAYFVSDVSGVGAWRAGWGGAVRLGGMVVRAGGRCHGTTQRVQSPRGPFAPRRAPALRAAAPAGGGRAARELHAGGARQHRRAVGLRRRR